MCGKYNGWANWETWNFYNWLTSDEGYQGAIDAYGIDGAIENWKEYLEGEIEFIEYGFLKDVAREGVHQIDWDEIREALKEG